MASVIGPPLSAKLSPPFQLSYAPRYYDIRYNVYHSIIEQLSCQQGNPFEAKLPAMEKAARREDAVSSHGLLIRHFSVNRLSCGSREQAPSMDGDLPAQAGGLIDSVQDFHHILPLPRMVAGLGAI